MIIALQALIYFRESLLNAFGRIISPYFKKLSLTFNFTGRGDASDDEEAEEVFADFDEDKGVVFFPPMYAQRYAAVSDCLMDERWYGKLEKIVDLGYHDMSFIKYLREVPGVQHIIGVDIGTVPLDCWADLLGYNESKKKEAMEITLFQGNAADPDYRLIGCDAVIAIEMIEHMLPHDLERLVHTIFGFIKPWIVVLTTPNGDFNVLFKSLQSNGYRRLDHYFEWSREQYHDWCSNIVLRYPNYTVTCKGIGPGPHGTQHLGCCSQMAVFVAKKYEKQADLHPNSMALVSDAPNTETINGLYTDSLNQITLQHKFSLNNSSIEVKSFSKHSLNLIEQNKVDLLGHTENVIDQICHVKELLNLKMKDKNDTENLTWSNFNWGENAPYWNIYYKVVKEFRHPPDDRSDDIRILDIVSEEIHRIVDTGENGLVDNEDPVIIPLEHLLDLTSHVTEDKKKLKDILEWNGYTIKDNCIVHPRTIVHGDMTKEEDWDAISFDVKPKV